MRRLWLLPVLIILTVCVYFYGTGSFGFLDNYETLYANNNFNINYILNSAAFYVFGENEFAGRIFQTIFGLGGAFLAYLSAKYLTGSRKASHTAVFITLTSPLYFVISRLNTPDAFFTFCFTLAVFGYIYIIKHSQILYSDTPSEFDILLTASKPVKGGLIFYSGMALASLSGGVIRGTIAPLIIASAHILTVNSGLFNFKDKSDKSYKIFLISAYKIFSPLISPWGILIYILILSPVFFNNNYLLNNSAFLVSSAINHLRYNNLMLTLLIIPAALVLIYPCAWSMCCPKAFVALLKSLFKLRGGNFLLAMSSYDAFLAALWAGIAFIFTFPNSAACIIPVSILISAMLIDAVINDPMRNIFKTLAFCALCMAAFSALLFYINAFHRAAVTESHRDIASAAVEYLKYENDGEITLYTYGEPMQSLNFYLKRGMKDIKIRNIPADSESSNEKEILRRIWNGASQVIIVIRRADAEDFISRIIDREPVKVGESACDFLFTNY